MHNARNTPTGRQACEMMRDDAANDNMGSADRQAMMAWAQERMHEPGWRDVAVRAMFAAQRR